MVVDRLFRPRIAVSGVVDIVSGCQTSCGEISIDIQSAHVVYVEDTYGDIFFIVVVYVVCPAVNSRNLCKLTVVIDFSIFQISVVEVAVGNACAVGGNCLFLAIGAGFCCFVFSMGNQFHIDISNEYGALNKGVGGILSTATQSQGESVFFGISVISAVTVDKLATLDEDCQFNVVVGQFVGIISGVDSGEGSECLSIFAVNVGKAEVETAVFSDVHSLNPCCQTIILVGLNNDFLTHCHLVSGCSLVVDNQNGSK